MKLKNEIPEKGKFLGIDYGEKRVGIAISDPLRIFASPYKTILYKSKSQLFEEIEKIIIDENIVFSVVGLPIGMNGQVTLQTSEVNNFINDFIKKNIVPVEKIDERLSSVQAIKLLNHQGIKPSKNKSLIDSTAAAIILQSFLDSIK